MWQQRKVVHTVAIVSSSRLSTNNRYCSAKKALHKKFYKAYSCSEVIGFVGECVLSLLIGPVAKSRRPIVIYRHIIAASD